MLPAVLSVIAGSVDAISFLGLGGLFTAHVTGNLVVLVAHLATGSRAPVANILSVPVFVAALGLTRLLAGVWRGSDSSHSDRFSWCSCYCSLASSSCVLQTARPWTHMQ